MQKNESKSTADNTKIKPRMRPVDIIIIAVCLAGAGFCAAAFWQEYNNTLVRLDEEPVGIIIFRKGVAQRRFIDRNMWDRLHQASPVYHGDIIRTIEKSEAIIILKDEVTHLSLDERTMIQVFFDGRSGAQIDFSGGYLGVTSESESILINSGGSAITVGGQVNMNKSEEGFVISVLDGTAGFNGAEIEAGGILALDPYGGICTQPVIAITSFGPSVHILGPPGEAVPVVFSWNSANFDADTHVILDVALDRGFNQILETKDVSGVSSVAVYLESGIYWWRAFPVDPGSRRPLSRLYPSGNIEVISAAAVHLRSPAAGEELIFNSDSVIPLSWSAVEGALAYLVEISANADISNPVISRNVQTNSVVETNLDFGRWYWRVTPVFPPMFRGDEALSATGSFRVTQGDPPVFEPILTSPLKNGNIYIDPAAAAGSRLFWAHDRSADSWFVEIADNPVMRNPVVRQNTAFNYFLLPQNLLHEGANWYWRVTAQSGESYAVSPVQNFNVTRRAPGARPVLARIPPAPVTRADPFLVLPPIIFEANSDGWYGIDAENILLQVVSILNSNSNLRLMVEGHANPVTNPNDTAARYLEQSLELQPLSEVRARAVKSRIIELGIAPNRLEYAGRGGEAPIAAWEDVNNWWRNRRVGFVLAE